jgi:hypothetical protein
MVERCGCCDPKCPSKHGEGRECGFRATVILYRIDMEDNDGTPFCDPCAEDAMESGLFRTEEDAEDEGDEEHEPTEGDYTMTPTGPLGSLISVGQVEGKHLGTFATDDGARQFIRDRMEREQFWPNVWNVSDHGNWDLTEV